MWTYRQTSGQLSDKNGAIVATGYSGAPGVTKNNPAYQDIHNEGPIPQGRWNIGNLTVGQTPHGPYVLHLFPEAGTNTFGRSGFLIHGDSIVNPGGASEGCVIMPRPIREQIWTSNDHELTVIA
jgi:hypothetical protein